MEPFEIVVDDLLIRPWRPEDADEVHRACQDPEVRRWTSIPSPYEREHAVGFVTRHTAEAWETGTAAPLGVFDAATGDLLGSNGLVSRHGRRAEIGYWTAPWARGRGVATRSSRAVARWAHDLLGVERLAWRAELGNHASRLVALRFGVAIEGVLRGDAARADGTLVDCWIGSVHPGGVTHVTPPEFAPGSLVARRTGIFGGPRATLPLVDVPGVLRPTTRDDIPAIVAMCSDPDSARWTPLPVPYTEEHAEGYVRDVAVGGWLRGDRPAFGMADPDGALCGLIDLRISPVDPGCAEVGYVVGPWARGGGFATAATRAICAWGFDALGLERIEWRAYPEHEGSRRVAEKAGFIIEGVERGHRLQRGVRRDLLLGAVLPADLR